MAKKNQIVDKVEVGEVAEISADQTNETENNIILVEKETIVPRNLLQEEVDKYILKNNFVLLSQVDSNGNECCLFDTSEKEYKKHYSDETKFKLKKK